MGGEATCNRCPRVVPAVATFGDGWHRGYAFGEPQYVCPVCMVRLWEDDVAARDRAKVRREFAESGAAGPRLDVKAYCQDRMREKK